jgi:hypothetical protein
MTLCRPRCGPGGAKALEPTVSWSCMALGTMLDLFTGDLISTASVCIIEAQAHCLCSGKGCTSVVASHPGTFSYIIQSENNLTSHDCLLSSQHTQTVVSPCVQGRLSSARMSSLRAWRKKEKSKTASGRMVTGSLLPVSCIMPKIWRTFSTPISPSAVSMSSALG